MVAMTTAPGAGLAAAPASTSPGWRAAGVNVVPLLREKATSTRIGKFAHCPSLHTAATLLAVDAASSSPPPPDRHGGCQGNHPVLPKRAPPITVRSTCTIQPSFPLNVMVDDGTGPAPNVIVIGVSCHPSVPTGLVTMRTPELSDNATSTIPRAASTSSTNPGVADEGRKDSCQWAPPSWVLQRPGP